jgi:hypothetical protein
VAYSEVGDLLFGSVPTVGQDLAAWVDRADEEIDAAIGNIYVTPVSFPSTTEARPGKLLVKKISSQLATGRAIMSMDAGSEESTLHQYGLYLIKEANASLKCIKDGDVILPGVQMISPDDLTSAPKVYNVDSSSAVEDFFGQFNTANRGPQGVPYWINADRWGG